MNKARDLLAASNMPIKQVAAAVGFDSIYYFSRLFKKKIGHAPRTFRQLARPGTAPS